MHPGQCGGEAGLPFPPLPLGLGRWIQPCMHDLQYVCLAIFTVGARCGGRMGLRLLCVCMLITTTTLSPVLVSPALDQARYASYPCWHREMGLSSTPWQIWQIRSSSGESRKGALIPMMMASCSCVDDVGRVQQLLVRGLDGLMAASRRLLAARRRTPPAE